MESDFATTLHASIFFSFILGSSESKAPKMHLAKDIVDFLLKQRVDGEKALILDLKKQSKVCIHLNKVLSGHFSFHFF